MLFFDAHTRDTADVFLADGLTDELITRLSQVRRLDVKSRFASERARAQRVAGPRALGRMVGAAYLVTGSVQRVGQRLRVNVALVRAVSGRQVWGEVYERTGDLLAIQGEISQAVAGAIAGTLLPQERAALAWRPTRDPVAFDLYLRGVGAANAYSEAGLRAGLEYLRRAIGRDSAFAAAHVQEGTIWIMLADGYVEGRLGYARSRSAAERALSLDSSLAEAYAMLSQAALVLDADAAGGRRLATRSLALNPRSGWGHGALCGALLATPGREDSAVAEARRGWEADTLSAVFAMPYLWVLSLLHRTDTLAAVLPRMASLLSPEDLRVFEGVVRLLRGDAAGAAARLTWSYYGGLLAAEYVRAQLALGRTSIARAAVDSMVALSGRGYYNAMGVARAYAALGEADSAFAWLDRAWEQRTGWMATLPLYAEFGPLRSDPRWTALLRRMGLTP